MTAITENQATRLFDGLKAFLAQAGPIDWLDSPDIEHKVIAAWCGKGMFTASPDTGDYTLIKFRAPNAGYIRIASMFGPDGFLPVLSNRLHARLREIIPTLEEL